MENAKQEILSKLYAIRAGLSTISLEKDKLYKGEKNVQYFKSKQDETEQIINKNLELIKANEQRLIYEEEGINNIKQIKQNKKKQALENKENHKPSLAKAILRSIEEALLIMLGGVIPTVIILLIIWFIAYITTETGAYLGLEVSYWVIGLIIEIIVSFLIVFIPKIKAYNDRIESSEKSYEYSIKDAEKSYNEDFKNYQERIANYNNEISLYKKEIDEKNSLRNKYNMEYKEAVNVYERIKKQVTLTVQTLFDYMVKEFNDFLDYRDWQNVDLIIFYIETKRAETIKEALYQVDRQNQVDTIVMACNEISASIRNLSSSMMITINNCFSDLESQMKKQYNSQIKMYENINNFMDLELDNVKNDVTEHIKSISSQQSIQNALISKIEVNTNELAKDMRYVLEQKKQKMY